MGIALQLTLGARLQSDGFYYYAYLRSMAFDRDVNFANDYRMLGSARRVTCFSRPDWIRPLRVDDRPGADLGAVLRHRSPRCDATCRPPVRPWPRRNVVSVSSGRLCREPFLRSPRVLDVLPPARRILLAANRCGVGRIHHRGLVHALVSGERADHDARLIDGSVAGFTWMWARDARPADAASVGRPRVAGRLDDADSLAESALRTSSRLRCGGARVGRLAQAELRALQRTVSSARALSRVPRSWLSAADARVAIDLRQSHRALSNRAGDPLVAPAPR